MVIGIDYLSTMKIVHGTAVYTGGSNYVKELLKKLKNHKAIVPFQIVLLVPNEFKPSSEEEELFDGNWLEFLYSNSLLMFDYKNLDILFLPQVNGRTLFFIPKIKKMYTKLKIYATLHDRQHNFYKFDWYDRFYYESIRYKGVVLFFEYYTKRILFNSMYNHCVKHIDKIFTVSNYSMQKLMNHNIKQINYFIQNNIVQKYTSLIKRGSYILFVGGGRPEKNLLRTLEAFCIYKHITQSRIKMFITGVSEKLVISLKKCSKVDSKIIDNEVEFFPYISYQELAELYAGSRYVVFTSKGEGYGLPVREAIGFGKVVLASRTTSVPEVAGAALYYIDPFSVKSILKGFEYYDDDENLNRHEKYILTRKEIISQISRQDTDIFIDELLDIKNV